MLHACVVFQVIIYVITYLHTPSHSWIVIMRELQWPRTRYYKLQSLGMILLSLSVTNNTVATVDRSTSKNFWHCEFNYWENRFINLFAYICSYLSKSLNHQLSNLLLSFFLSNICLSYLFITITGIKWE